MQGVGSGRFGPLRHFPHTSLPPFPSANEKIDNPQSIHVLVDVRGKKGREGYGRRERRERQEKRDKWGKLRNNGQYFVIEKSQEKRGRDPGLQGTGGRRTPTPPPPPHLKRAPSPLLLYYVDGSLVSWLVLKLILLHIYHVTEVYCPDDSFPVVPLISWLGEYFLISTENI